MFIVITLLVLILCLSLGLSVRKPLIRKCHSLSCGYNLRGKCSRAEIDIYDNNGLIGVCLWHTKDMLDRIPKIYNQGQSKGIVVDKLLKRVEESGDAKAIKDPEVFKKWMQNHGIKNLDQK